MLAVEKEEYTIPCVKDIKWSSTHAAVIGAGRSGLAAAKLLKALGATIRIIDKNSNNVSDEVITWAKYTNCEIVFGDHCQEQFEDIEVVVPSPGVAYSKLQPFLSDTTYLLSETEFAWYQLVHEKVIAITGTSGKTTTVSLCKAMLDEQGISSFVAGNIGIPLSEYVLGKEKVDIVILELSSFQLQTCMRFRPDVAVLLNISFNHLDYHSHMDEYIAAKMHICKCQHSTDVIILKSEMKFLVEDYGVKSEVLLYQDTGMFSSMQLLGGHNRENAEAAWMACRMFGVTSESAKKAVEMFIPLEHRLEHVRELHGIRYVNDSKGTTVEALRAALESFDQPILLLAGGIFKGGDLLNLRSIIKEKVRVVGLFGDSRKVFENAWSDLVPIYWNETLEAAVKQLSCFACFGDVILLAPATSSFDQYANYIDRGNDFKRIVNKVLI